MALSDPDDIWQDHAACVGQVNVFYPDPTPPVMPWAYDPARQICFRCPVRAACLGYVREHPQIGGMWAGMTEDERREDRRRWRRRHLTAAGIGGPRPALVAIGDEPPAIQPTLLAST